MFAVLKGLAGLLAVGTTIFVPTYLTTKSSNLTENKSEKVKVQLRIQPPISPEQRRQEKKFDDCLDSSLTFRVKNKSDGSELKIVSSKEVRQYLDESKYEIESLYAGQCNKDKVLSTLSSAH
ncbi:hypothetical protein DNK47_02575 [Mycoplasma wenyonii]|uniref:Uncharacterized protein n=1 Tax=Mycoplasma wenyonii TaxID=65123 RepID=A0A328PME1_9MOLU|nr:hypothetical protein [Mycoplasma wenyonii]RAO94895.1 hypothetical protein DNK47_02575 [Mycoplasma wenyonii]